MPISSARKKIRSFCFCVYIIHKLIHLSDQISNQLLSWLLRDLLNVCIKIRSLFWFYNQSSLFCSPSIFGHQFLYLTLNFDVFIISNDCITASRTKSSHLRLIVSLFWKNPGHLAAICSAKIHIEKSWKVLPFYFFKLQPSVPQEMCSLSKEAQLLGHKGPWRTFLGWQEQSLTSHLWANSSPDARGWSTVNTA